VLDRACILYVDVSFEESLRKNRRRFRPGQEDSILYHSLEDAKMERYYRTDDWRELTGDRDDGYLTIRAASVLCRVPQRAGTDPGPRAAGTGPQAGHGNADAALQAAGLKSAPSRLD